MVLGCIFNGEYEMSDQQIYSMTLHDELELWQGLEVLRVPGGWIYKEWRENGTGGVDMCTTFVPYHNEFEAT